MPRKFLHQIVLDRGLVTGVSFDELDATDLPPHGDEPGPTPGVPGCVIDARSFGVRSDVADCTEAFRTLVQNAPKGAMIKLGCGGHTVTGTVDAYTGIKTATHTDCLWVEGSGAAPSLGTSINGNFAGPLLAYNRGGNDVAASVRLRGIRFTNSHAQGECVRLERVDDGLIQECGFEQSNVGLVVGALQATNVEVHVDRCWFVSDLTRFPNSVGASLNMHGSLSRSLAQRCGTAFLLGRQVEINKLRCEVNTTCIVTGEKLGGGAVPYAGSWNGVSTEASVNAIVIKKPTTRVDIRCLFVHGTGISGVGDADYGVDYQAAAGYLTLATSTIAGNFGVSAMNMKGNGPAVFIGVFAQNGSGTAWDLGGMTATKWASIQSNTPSAGVVWS